MRRSWLIVAVLLIATFAALAQQPTSGTMNVRVTDNEGKPLPGATITVTGPLGQRAAQTDAEGVAELRFLPGGVYQLRVEMAGFAPMQYSKVGVNVGQTTRVPVKLQAGTTEEITVTSATPLLDVKRVEVTTSFRTENTIETMPIGRNFSDAVAFAPGVVSGLGTGAGNYSIGGSSGLENSYLIDGVNITDSGYGGVGSYSIVYGSLGTGITTEFLEEVQVKTAGFEAEYGQALGGVISGVVKSGTNDFSGGVSLYATPGSWEAYGKDVSLPTGAVNVHEREEYDIGLQVGGPLLKDRMFWFVAYNPVSTSNLTFVQELPNPVNAELGGGNVDYPLDAAYQAGLQSRETARDRNNYAAKLNFLATPNHRVELTAFGDPSDGDGRTGIRATEMNLYADVAPRDGVPDATGGKNPASFNELGVRSTIDYGADQQSLKYNGLFGGNFFVEAQVNHRQNEFTETSTVNDWNYSDVRTTREWQFGGTIPAPVTLQSGGAGYIGPTKDETYDYALKATWTLGNHELKAGLQYFDSEYTQTAVYSGPTIDFPFPRVGGGAPVVVTSTSGALVSVRNGLANCPGCAFLTGNTDFRVTRARFSPANDPVQGKETSFFVQDNWSIGDKWNIKLGLRTSTQELTGAGAFTLPFTAVIQPSGFYQFTDEPSTYAPNSYKFDTEISPRLGVTFDPRGDGRSKFFASAARYFQRIPSDLAVRQFSNEVGTSRFTFGDPNLTTRISSNVLMQGLEPGVVADGTKLPYVDEYVLGWQQLLTSDLSMEIRGIFRDQGRVLEDVQNTTVEEIQNLYYGNVYYDADFNDDGTIQDSEEPFPGFGNAPFGAYVLANVGENTTGPFGDVVREYKALEFQLIKRLSNNWQMSANYRYSKLRGNYEGLFRNDNGQSDPNITSLFDFPNSPLMRGQYNSGALNTDRPHVLNILGTYFLDNGFEVGGSLRWQSGVPRTALLAHPNYQNSGELPGSDPQYIDQILDPETGVPIAWTSTPGTEDNTFQNIHGFTFLSDYTDAPRGSLGRTPDFASIDLHVGWQRGIGDTNLKLTVDVFNVFNMQEVSFLNDNVEFTATVLDPNFNRITGYQAPRSVRAAVIWDF